MFFEILKQEFYIFYSFKENSKRAYQTDLKIFNAFLIEKFEEFNWQNSNCLKNLNKEDILLYLKERFNPRAVNRRITNIRKFILWLNQEKEYNISLDWKASLKLKDPESKKEAIDFNFNKEKIEYILNSNILNIQEKIMFLLITELALSLEEISNLCIEDLNLGNLPTISISKGNKRILSISEQLKLFFINLCSNELEGWIFKKKNNKKFSGDNIGLILKIKLSKILGIKISASNIQNFARKNIIENKGLNYTAKITGRKKKYSLINNKEKTLNEDYFDKLRNIHTKAFI